MKKNIFIIAVTLLVTLITGRTMAQQQPSLDKQTAEKLIRSIQQLVNDSNYQQLGFSSPAEAKNVTLGRQIKVSVVPLDKLKEQDENTGSLKAIKTSSASSFYELINERSQQPVALANVETKDGKSTIRGFGSTALAKSIAEIYGGLTPEMKNGAELIRILALQLDFIAVTDQTNTQYIPVVNIPELSIEKGSRLDEKTLLSKILPLARRYNGLPW